MSTALPIIISSLALLISGLTAWLTFFQKGRLCMTQPTTVFFGPDGKEFEEKNKVYLRTLLYSTAKRGVVIESLHLAVQRNETRQNFNVWVHGQRGDLERGSGLFVPQEGITLNHHFLLPEDGADFKFLPGMYTLTVYAKAVGQTKPKPLRAFTVTVSEELSAKIAEPGIGIYFDWSADHQTYHAHARGPNRGKGSLASLLALAEGAG